MDEQIKIGGSYPKWSLNATIKVYVKSSLSEVYFKTSLSKKLFTTAGITKKEITLDPNKYTSYPHSKIRIDPKAFEWRHLKKNDLKEMPEHVETWYQVAFEQ